MLHLAICIYVLIAPLILLPGIVTNVFVLKAAWVTAGGAVLLWAWERRHRSLSLPSVRTGLEAPLGFLLFVSVVSGIPGPLSPFPLVTMVVYMGLFYLFVQRERLVRSNRLAEDPLAWGLLGAVSNGVYILFQSHGLDPFPWAGGVPDWRGKLPGFMGGPNFAGGFMAVLLPYAIFLATRKDHRFWPGLVSLVLLLSALSVTFVMGAWLGILVALLVCLSVSRIRTTILSGRALIPILLFGLVALFYLTDNPYNGIGRSVLREAASSDRWKTGHGARRFIWGTTFLMIRENPVLGIGFGSYYRVHQVYQGRYYALRDTPHDRRIVSNVPQVHNEYLQQWAETGLAGLLVVIWLIGAGIRSIRRAIPRIPDGEFPRWTACFAGLVIGMVIAFQSFPLRIPPTALVLLLLAGEVFAPGAVPRDPRIRSRFLLPGAVLLMGLLVGLSPLVSDLVLTRGLPTRNLRPRLLAVQVCPVYVPALEKLAVAFGALGQPEAALETSARAVETVENIGMRIFRRDLLFRMGRFEEAAREGRIVISLNPCYAPLLVEQANLESQAGHGDLERSSLRQATRYLRMLAGEHPQEFTRQIEEIRTVRPDFVDELRDEISVGG